jgi:hypothetical protein
MKSPVLSLAPRIALVLHVQFLKICLIKCCMDNSICKHALHKTLFHTAHQEIEQKHLLSLLVLDYTRLVFYLSTMTLLTTATRHLTRRRVFLPTRTPNVLILTSILTRNFKNGRRTRPCPNLERSRHLHFLWSPRPK